MDFQPDSNISVLREGLSVLRRRYYIVILVVALCGTASWLLVRSQPKMYRAQTRLMIEPRQSRFSGAETGTSGTAYYYFYRYELQTQIMLIKSRPVAERVVAKLNLNEEGPFAGQLDATAAPRPEGEPERPEPDVAKLVMGITTAEPVGETRFIDVSVQTVDPLWSAKIANTIAEEYIAENIDHRRRLIREAIGAYSNKFPEFHEKLQKAEAELAQFLEKEEYIISSERPEDAMRTQELELMTALAGARQERVAAQARLMSNGSTGDEESTVALSQTVASDDPWMRQLLNDRLTQLSLINELRKSFSEGHPKLASAETRLEEIQKELERATRSYNSRLKQSHQAALWKEKEIARFLEEHRNDIKKLRSSLSRYEALLQKRDSYKALLDPLARGAAELDLAANIELANATIMEKATVPSSPSHPNKLKYMLVAAVLGLALGGWLAYAVDGLDETIRSPDNLRTSILHHRVGSLHILGTISQMNRKIARHERGRAFAADSTSSFALAEEFRSLRTGLLSVAPWRKSNRSGVVLVTSPGLGEGKTTVSVNAAEAFAQLGKPVVLVDADIRRARTHEVLECEREPGLVDVLEGRVALKDAVKPTKLPHLFILPAGSETPRPAEILASDKVEQLIDELKSEYGLVWIDSPPVMLVADARTIAPFADLMLIVVRSMKTRRREFERTYELIATAAGVHDDPDAASRIVAVVNGAPQSVAKQSGYYRSGYGAYYNPPATNASTSSAPPKQPAEKAEAAPEESVQS